MRTADSGSPTLLLTGKRGSPPAFKQSAETVNIKSGQLGAKRLAQQATATGRTAPTASVVAGLARFFPEAAPVRIPVQLARNAEAGKSEFTESTVIEYGTPHEVLFACITPLEFADVLHLRNSDGSLDIEASVVAVQYHPGNTVVAARFLSAVPNWIVK
jgi:hypothetical protein